MTTLHRFKDCPCLCDDTESEDPAEREATAINAAVEEQDESGWTNDDIRAGLPGR